jgi:glycopeptide antibiotics resistance protein
MLFSLFSVEVIQLLTFAGSFDIDDVILNIIGAALMYWLWKLKATQGLLKKVYVLKRGE